MKLMSICQLNQEYFPFDVQECYFDFRSSAYYLPQLNLTSYGEGVHLSLIQEGEFDLIKSEAQEFFIDRLTDITNTPTNSSISVIRVKLLMKRKIVFYLNKIILPYFIFYIVTIFTYILPVDSGEKKSYSTSILISAMIYLKDTSYYIPKTSFLPMLSIYFNLNLIFVFLCIIMTTFIYVIYYFDKTKRPLPGFFRKIFQKRI